MQFSTWIYTSISLLIQYYADKDKAEDLSKSLDSLEGGSFPKVTTFDFIIVGGGTAGCLLAGKLSEHYDVLLIESGGSPPPATASPTLDRFVDAHPAINNIFGSVPQLNSSQENGGILISSTGRMLGGSGSHNANIYNRGSPLDYDNIARLVGDDSWKYENILKYFKTFENYVGSLVNEEEREEYYGDIGEITVNSAEPPIKQGWYEAAEELGYVAGDSNGYQRPSFTLVAKSIKNGERSSAYTAFVEPVEDSRPSLTIHRYSVAEEILIDSSKKAYGVAYSRHGIPQLAHASKEVIISCGTIQSPLLLIKSGIGPQATLEAARIPVINNLEGVGKNLYNHAWVWLDFQMNNPNETLLYRINEADFLEEVRKYEEEKSGYYTGLFEGLQAFVPSSVAISEGQEDWADLQIIYISPVLRDQDPVGVALIVDLNRPKSVGEIRFDSEAWARGERDDTKLALIDWKLFSVESDFQAVIDGINISFRIFENTTVFRNVGVEFKTGSGPVACEGFPFRSYEYWKCFVEQRAQNDLHMVGTCSMGRDEDPLAVLDSKFRVRGIENLRVIDSSALPAVPNANINSAVMMTASKGVEDILTKYPPEVKAGTGVELASFGLLAATVLGCFYFGV